MEASRCQVNSNGVIAPSFFREWSVATAEQRRCTKEPPMRRPFSHAATVLTVFLCSCCGVARGWSEFPSIMRASRTPSCR